MTSDKVLYFAFGSNLLRQRIHVMNPSAVFKTTAVLKDYRLDFNGTTDDDSTWRGPGATIEPHPGLEVWGVVWELDNADIPNLDRQEGVEKGTYEPLQVQVQSSSGDTLLVRTYKMTLPEAKDRRPSPQYLDVIIRGAKQNSMPASYIEQLEAIKHNGNQIRVELYEQLLRELGE